MPLRRRRTMPNLPQYPIVHSQTSNYQREAALHQQKDRWVVQELVLRMSIKYIRVELHYKVLPGGE